MPPDPFFQITEALKTQSDHTTFNISPPSPQKVGEQ